MTHNGFVNAQQTGLELEAVTQALPVKTQAGRVWHFNALKHLQLFLDDLRMVEQHEREAGNIK
jgi:hypothetical protein